MTELVTPDTVAEAPPRPAAAAVNIGAAALFALAALAFVLFYVYRYTLWWNDHLNHVLFGLWGLYFSVALACGALRVRPRENRTGLYQALMWAAFAQGFFLAILWGAMLIEAEAPTLAYSGAAALFAGPVLALGFALAARRGLVLILAEVLGPAAFLVLWKFGG